MQEIILLGKVKEGLRIASGQNPDPALKLNNTIFKQKPFFIKNGVDKIENCYNGTVNLDISPHHFKILKPDYEITCEWSPGTIETFWLVRADIIFKERTYSGYIYYPCPSLVKSHKDNIVELLAPQIESLEYGDRCCVKVSADKVKLLDFPVQSL